MEVTAAELAESMRAAVASHERMWAAASGMSEDDCRVPSLLPGWSRGHVLAHWARNADSQVRMLLGAMRGEIADQYPGGDAQREADIEAGAARPGPVPGSTIRVEVTDGPGPLASAAATTSGAPAVVRGTAAAVLCWLTGRPVPAPADLAASRWGQSWPLPQLRPWS